MAESSNGSGGIGFGGLLQIVFITLKLTHVIVWKWLWVLAPTWIGVGLWCVIILVVFIIMMFNNRATRKRRAALRGR